MNYDNYNFVQLKAKFLHGLSNRYVKFLIVLLLNFLKFSDIFVSDSLFAEIIFLGDFNVNHTERLDSSKTDPQGCRKFRDQQLFDQPCGETSLD